MTTLSVCIPSIGRPSLVRCLESVTSSDLSGLDVSVFIADDSSDGEVARTLAEGVSITLVPQVVVSAARNISAARNALLDAATGDFLLFVDDDEWLEPNAIQRLLTTARDNRASAVFGAVESQYPREAPDWCREIKPYDRRVAPTGTRVPTGATSIVLVSRVAIERHALRFDKALGRTGGEDTDFFGKLHQHGEKLITCAEAIAYEMVPVKRLEPRYILDRYTRGGQSFAQTTLEGRRGLSKFAALAGIFGKAAIATGGDLLTRPLSPGRNMRWRIKAAGQYGQLRHLFRRPLKTLY